MIPKALLECIHTWWVTYDILAETIIEPQGYIFPAFLDRTLILPLSGITISDVEDFIERYRGKFSEKLYLGLWISPKSEVYIDIVQVSETEEEARKTIQNIHKISQRKIESMYDTKNNQEIFL